MNLSIGESLDRYIGAYFLVKNCIMYNLVLKQYKLNHVCITRLNMHHHRHFHHTCYIIIITIIIITTTTTIIVIIDSCTNVIIIIIN